MGQLYVPVLLRNAREYVLAQHGHQAFETVHTYETTDALIDTGASASLITAPGMFRLGMTPAILARDPAGYGAGMGGFIFSGGPTSTVGGPSPNQFNNYAAFLLGLPNQVGKNVILPDELTTRGAPSE